jgi:hypothetical protein
MFNQEIQIKMIEIKYRRTEIYVIVCYCRRGKRLFWKDTCDLVMRGGTDTANCSLEEFSYLNCRPVSR